MVQPEIAFIVNYRCPRCQAALEARTRESYTWLRCPRCGRASLPPEPMRKAPAPQPLGDDVLVIGDTPDLRSLAPAAHAEPGSARRIALAVGILASLTMLMLSFVDGNNVNVTIFGSTTLALFGIVIYFAARRR